MRKLQRELQKHDGPDHSVRDVRRPSWEDADKLEAEIMTPRDRLQRLLFEHRTDPIYNVCLRCGQVGHCSASCPNQRAARAKKKE